MRTKGGVMNAYSRRGLGFASLSVPETSGVNARASRPLEGQDLAHEKPLPWSLANNCSTVLLYSVCRNAADVVPAGCTSMGEPYAIQGAGWPTTDFHPPRPDGADYRGDRADQLASDKRCDFADIFEVKSGNIVRRGRITTNWSESRQSASPIRKS